MELFDILKRIGDSEAEAKLPLIPENFVPRTQLVASSFNRFFNKPFGQLGQPETEVEVGAEEKEKVPLTPTPVVPLVGATLYYTHAIIF